MKDEDVVSMCEINRLFKKTQTCKMKDKTNFAVFYHISFTSSSLLLTNLGLNTVRDNEKSSFIKILSRTNSIRTLERHRRSFVRDHRVYFHGP